MKKVVYIANNMGTVQNCTKTKLHEGTHEDTFAQGDKIARRQFCTKGQFCTGSVLHESKKNRKNNKKVN